MPLAIVHTNDCHARNSNDNIITFAIDIIHEAAMPFIFLSRPLLVDHICAIYLLEQEILVGILLENAFVHRHR